MENECAKLGREIGELIDAVTKSKSKDRGEARSAIAEAHRRRDVLGCLINLAEARVNLR